MLLLVALVVACLLAPCVEGFVLTPAASGGARRRAAVAAVEGAGRRRIAAGTEKE